ncbi:MAG TPA: hypothetical protein VKZ53_26780 [Candidatus Angelobacter sp.]|nr:hypothetical protein [Candidatus Angelobacter sp.]
MKQSSRTADCTHRETVCLRKPIDVNSKLIESHCFLCSSFLAASQSTLLLDLVEKLHHCEAAKISNSAPSMAVMGRYFH